MRYLGIDFGSKRVGVAVSDEFNSFAFPLAVLQNDDFLLQEIKNLIEKYATDVVVIGESKNFSQEDNAIMVQVRAFAEKIEKELGVTVHLHPEFLSSLEAKQLQGKNDMLDASAAAIILKSYLDTYNNSNGDNN